MDFDLTNLPAGFIDDPHPHYAALRAAAPVHKLPTGGLFLSRHADLLRVYKDRNVFSSDKKIEFRPKFGDSLLYQHHTTSLVFNDAPLHTRVRRAIAGALSPRAIAGMDSVVQALVDGLINTRDDRHGAGAMVDAVADFAQNIPIEVIGNLLAIPRHERGPLRDWSLAILGALEPEISADQFDLGETAVREFLAYLDALVARARRRHRQGDRHHGAADPRDRRGRRDANLLPHELLQNCIFILNAGHETTTNLICSGIWLLSQRPRIVERLNAEPELWPAAVEEILRMESPNQLGNRRALSTLKWAEGPGRGNADHAWNGCGESRSGGVRRADSFRLDAATTPSCLRRRCSCLCRQHHCPDRGTNRSCWAFRPLAEPEGGRGHAPLATGPVPRVRVTAASSLDAGLVAVVDGTGHYQRER